ncbi:MAG TPA: 30S ribosomal protein S20 [bacterium]
MAIKKRSKSVLKNIRQARRRHAANTAKKQKLRLSVKKLKKAKSKTEAMKLYRPLQSQIDKLVQDSIINKKTAGRMKSKLLRAIQAPTKK